MLRNVVGRTSRSGSPLGRVLQDPLFAQRNRRAWTPAAGLEARATINAGVRLCAALGRIAGPTKAARPAPITAASPSRTAAPRTISGNRISPPDSPPPPASDSIAPASTPRSNLVPGYTGLAPGRAPS